MLAPKVKVVPTPKATNPSAVDINIIQHAIREAQSGLEQGGVPIGAALYNHETGTLLGVGRNQRVQLGSPTRHGETDCLENIGRLPARVLRQCTMYTTLSPCTMCTGAIILFGIPRVVMGENETFVGGEGILKDHGVEVINLDLPVCKDLMAKFIEAKPDVWWEDVGEDDDPSFTASTTSAPTAASA